VFEGNQEVWEHTVDSSTGRIVALMARNGDPLLVAALKFPDPFAAVAELKIAGFAHWTQKFAAVR
jgi:uncharacterized secreted protein with C-terminal beta-propeller domain